VSASEHVTDIEKFIQTLKERGRSTYFMLPLKKITLRMRWCMQLFTGEIIFLL